MIYEARVKDERQKVENIRNKGPDGIKEWYNFIQGNNRSNEVEFEWDSQLEWGTLSWSGGLSAGVGDS
ncbi:hypothetical protein FHG87_012698 [Trinorchestia longiramus]|nr:hypothetical protein FHG87_012698 [Trinorchestia longiramus]